ncbi:hypothetical protein VIGAN_03132700 [Vigna angularis var. angularis]|uniref:RNA helicase n=1 Tax=Vigna angularis var. angularis TaxID=157739 RepID=A0A0S3RM03_PHAAN|nr:hypothetical protein VIGAN_03132700 [Vigna angularis var. angularis]
MVSKMIIACSQLGCSEEIITIAVVLSVQSIWISRRGIQKGSDEAKLRFAAAEGDHVTFLNVYKGFHQSGKSSQWCNKNYVNYHAMRKVLEVREQLKRITKRIGLVLKSCESDMQAYTTMRLCSSSLPHYRFSLWQPCNYEGFVLHGFNIRLDSFMYK